MIAKTDLEVSEQQREQLVGYVELLVTQEIMQIALKQAKAARLHILNVMDEAISAPSEELSMFAPHRK